MEPIPGAVCIGDSKRPMLSSCPAVPHIQRHDIDLVNPGILLHLMKDLADPLWRKADAGIVCVDIPKARIAVLSRMPEGGEVRIPGIFPFLIRYMGDNVNHFRRRFTAFKELRPALFEYHLFQDLFLEAIVVAQNIVSYTFQCLHNVDPVLQIAECISLVSVNL